MRIEAPDARALAGVLKKNGFDLLRETVTEGSFDLIVSAGEMAALRRLGLEPLTLEVGRPFAEIQAERMEAEAAAGGVPVGYPDLAQIIAQMGATAEAHAGICQLVDLTATYGAPPTVNGRHMYAVKISDHVALDEDEPAVLLVSDHHAREIPTPVIALHAIEQLTDNYGMDPAITALVNQTEIWIAPVWNPDGYDYVFTGDNYWRKNRHVFPGGTGVDLNRNYPQGWSNPCSGDTSPSSEVYKGPSPASEAETQTMIAWSQAERFAKVLDFHTYGEEVLRGYLCWNYPFDAWFQTEAVAISTAAGYGGSVRDPSADGEHYQWQFAKQGAYAFLMETERNHQPSYSAALAEAAQVWPAAKLLMQRSIPLWGHVTDSVTGDPLEASIAYAGVTFLNGETNASGGPFGRYHAFLPAGTYDVQFSATGYETRTVTGVVVTSGGSTNLDITLDPEGVTSVAEATGETTGHDRLLAVTSAPEPQVRYEIAAAGQASVKVYDVRGALVRTLASSPHAAGAHEARWNGLDEGGSRASAGIYFVRLVTGRGAITGKTLLVR